MILGAPEFTFLVTAVDSRGRLLWAERIHNLVVNSGKNDLLNKYFRGSAYTAAWFLGLKGSGAPALTDTLAGGAWSEVTAYGGTRPPISFGAASGQSCAAAKVNFSMTSAVSVAGVLIANVASGTGGVLYSAGDFSTFHSLHNGDVLSVIPTVSAA